MSKSQNVNNFDRCVDMTITILYRVEGDLSNLLIGEGRRAKYSHESYAALDLIID